jgi:hypothetical protein
MIWTSLVEVAGGLVDLMLSPLPAAGDLGIGAYSELFELLASLNAAIPVTELMQAFAVWATVHAVIVVYITVRLAIRALPFMPRL